MYIVPYELGVEVVMFMYGSSSFELFSSKEKKKVTDGCGYQSIQINVAATRHANVEPSFDIQVHLKDANTR